MAQHLSSIFEAQQKQTHQKYLVNEVKIRCLQMLFKAAKAKEMAKLVNAALPSLTI